MKFAANVVIKGGFGRHIEAKSGEDAFAMLYEIVKKEFGSGYNYVGIELQEIKEGENAAEKSSDEYISSRDIVSEWVKNNIEPEPGHEVSLSILYSSFIAWCDREGILKKMGKNKFGMHITSYLKERKCTDNGVICLNIKLKNNLLPEGVKMTVKTWRKEILKVCKYCKHLFDRKISRNRYFCYKYECHVYDAHGCGKTKSIREEAAAISKKAYEEAFNNLTKRAKT